MTEVTLTNALVVLADTVVKATLHIRDGIIADLPDTAAHGPAAIDMAGDYLIPGLIDVHTDALEKQAFPRPNVAWDPVSAAIMHDAVCVSAGTTTVYNALSVGGDILEPGRTIESVVTMLDGLADGRRAGLLKADHRFHLRCEVTCDTLPILADTAVAAHPADLISYMDHTPGQRQYADPEVLRRYQAESGYAAPDIDASFAKLRHNHHAFAADNKAYVAELARAGDIPLASHDDANQAHVEEAAALGASICEFPVSLEAAAAGRASGLTTVMGAPNVVRGRSSAGNVTVAEVAGKGLLDILSSDYVPRSLLDAAIKLTRAPLNWSLPRAISTVTANPASALGLTDRGSIAPGLRADLVRIGVKDGYPLVRAVWVAGVRVA